MSSSFSLRSQSSVVLYALISTNAFVRRSFSFNAPRLWNSLPPAIRVECSYNVFKRLLKAHFSLWFITWLHFLCRVVYLWKYKIQKYKYLNTKIQIFIRARINNLKINISLYIATYHLELFTYACIIWSKTIFQSTKDHIWSSKVCNPHFISIRWHFSCKFCI